MAALLGKLLVVGVFLQLSTGIRDAGDYGVQLELVHDAAISLELDIVQHFGRKSNMRLTIGPVPASKPCKIEILSDLGHKLSAPLMSDPSGTIVFAFPSSFPRTSTLQMTLSVSGSTSLRRLIMGESVVEGPALSFNESDEDIKNAGAFFFVRSSTPGSDAILMGVGDRFHLSRNGRIGGHLFPDSAVRSAAGQLKNWERGGITLDEPPSEHVALADILKMRRPSPYLVPETSSYNFFATFSGKKDKPGETIAEGAIREVTEELGIHASEALKRGLDTDAYIDIPTSFGRTRLYLHVLNASEADAVEKDFYATLAEKVKDRGVCNADGQGVHGATGPDDTRTKPGYFFPRALYTAAACVALEEGGPNLVEDCKHASNAVERYLMLDRAEALPIVRQYEREHAAYATFRAKAGGLCEVHDLKRVPVKSHASDEMLAWFSAPNDWKAVTQLITPDGEAIPVQFLWPHRSDGQYLSWDTISELFLSATTSSLPH